MSTLSRHLTPRTIGFIIATIVVILYWPSVHHGFIDIDDPGFVTGNSIVQDASLRGIFRAFASPSMLLYLPVTLLSYQANFLFSGLDPAGFHALNILLHAVNGALVFGLLLRLSGSRFSSFLCAFIFAVHPLHSEAVLWIAARKDLLSATFALLSIHFYLRYLQESDAYAKWWSFGFFALGMLSKVAIFPLPLVFLILDRWHGWNDLKEMLRDKIFAFFIAVPLLVIGIVAGNQFALSLRPLEFLLLAAKSTAFLLYQFVWPNSLSLLHVQTSPATIADPSFYVSLIVLAALLAALFISWRRKYFLVALALGLFLLLLLPSFNAAQKGGMLFFTADRYAYLPSVGLLIILCDFLRHTQRKNRAVFFVLTGVLSFLSAALILKTREIVPAWRDAQSVEEWVLNSDPRNPIALSNLGVLSAKTGDSEKAAQLQKRSIDSDPHYAIPYLNAASSLRTLGRESEAIALYDAMIPMLTAREVRGDKTLQTVLLRLLERLPGLGRADLAEELQKKLIEIAPATMSRPSPSS